MSGVLRHLEGRPCYLDHAGAQALELAVFIQCERCEVRLPVTADAEEGEPLLCEACRLS